MKIKLSELIKDEAERMFIASFCKNMDKYYVGDVDLIDICIGISESIKTKQMEIFEIFFDTEEEEFNCFVSLCNGFVSIDCTIDKKILIEYIYGSENNPDKMEFSEKYSTESAAKESLTELLKNFFEIFFNIYFLSGLQIKHFSDLFDYKKESTQ